MNTHDKVELPPLPEWIQEQVENDTKYPVSTMITAMRGYACATIEPYAQRIAELEAARIAYASEFAPDEDGEPDVGRIHENIRKLKAERQRRGEPIKLQHMAVSDEHGLRWMSGRQHPAGVDSVELYAMPDFGRAPDLYAAPQPTEPTDEVAAMEAVMESIDPATWPGLTSAQRCALGRFAKPQPAEPVKKPYPVKMHAWGGVTRYHDYEMSDGSIQTLKDTEAKALRQERKPAEPVKSTRPDGGIDADGFFAQLEAEKPAEPVKPIRDWAEDASHENGNYQCKCVYCGEFFVGHKRRVVCKACSEPVKVDAKASVPSDEDIFNELQAHGALTTINTVNAVRALLARYGQPAASAEPELYGLRYAKKGIVSMPVFYSRIEAENYVNEAAKLAALAWKRPEIVPLYAAPVAAQPSEETVDIEDHIASEIARGKMTREEFLEARKWVRDTYYPVAARANVPDDDAIYLGCARMGLAGASDEEVLNYVRIAKRKTSTPPADEHT